VGSWSAEAVEDALRPQGCLPCPSSQAVKWWVRQGAIADKNLAAPKRVLLQWVEQATAALCLASPQLGLAPEGWAGYGPTAGRGGTETLVPLGSSGVGVTYTHQEATCWVFFSDWCLSC